MHFLFSNEGNRLVLDKVIPFYCRKELFASPGSYSGAFSDDLVYKTDQFYILYIGLNRFDFL